MKEKRRITFTGKNLNDIFKLPCVQCIRKKEGKPLVVLAHSYLQTFRAVAHIGDTLVEYDNGLWEIEHVKH